MCTSLSSQTPSQKSERGYWLDRLVHIHSLPLPLPPPPPTHTCMCNFVPSLRPLTVKRLCWVSNTRISITSCNHWCAADSAPPRETSTYIYIYTRTHPNYTCHTHTHTHPYTHFTPHTCTHAPPSDPLLHPPANPNVRSAVSSNEVTPLHIAAGCGHLACLQLLVQSGGDIMVQDRRQLMPIDYANMNGQDLCLNYLHDVISTFVMLLTWLVSGS